MEDEDRDDWTPPYGPEDFGFQTTQVSPKYTGLPFSIFFWSDWRPAQVDRIRVELEIEPRRFCGVSVEDAPKQLARCDISPADFEKVSQFILKNRSAIEVHWRGETGSKGLLDALQLIRREYRQHNGGTAEH